MFIGLALLLAFTFLYFDTRTEVHTFDALSYTHDVETKPPGQLYHPHHLLYGVTGRLAFDLAQNLGYEGRADTPIQFMNALAGALGVILLWLFGEHFTGKRWLPIGIAILIGMCYAYWFYATEVEVYTLAAVFIILTLWFLVRLERNPDRKEVIFAGLATTGAVMFHQTNIMFVVPVGVYFLLDFRLRKYLVLYIGVTALTVAIPYVAVGWNSGFRDIHSYYDWLTGYAQTGQWGSNLNLDSLEAVRAGLKNTISPENGTLAAIFYALAIIGLLPGVRHVNKSWIGLSFTWLILYGAFFWWWEPWNIEFWIVLLPLWALWMMMGVRSPTNKFTGYEIRSRLKPTDSLAESTEVDFLPHSANTTISITALLLAVLLFRTHNNPIRQAADSQNDYYQQITQTLAPHLEQTDLVVTRGNILDLYLPFYAEHPPSFVVSLRELSFSGDNKVDALINRITPAYHQGQLIFIDQILLDEPIDGQRNPFGLTTEEIAALKTQFPISGNVIYEGNNVFYSIGKRTSPETKSWSFENQLHGWQAFGLNNPRFENGGWCFTGGGDPWIESPDLRVETSEYTHLEIEIEIFSPAKEGQVFWMRQDEGLSEDRSFRFPLQEGRHIYRLELANQQGWTDEIVFLRLDPIPENTGVTACVYSIRLLTRSTGFKKEVGLPW